MTRKKIICGILLFLCMQCVSAQEIPGIVQTIRGKVIESETKYPLPGAVIVVFRDSVVLGGGATDDEGNYSLSNISIGRVRIRYALTGFNERIIDNVQLTSAKEMILNIELEQSVIEMAEVEVKATREGDALNEMATVSARQFSVGETDRYAGSRGDPARMASNFAGVQGADDSRNDIVIRGNSPQGVLWRMDGIDIPNPNHFNIPGTAGGPVSIINNKYLANSDFYTGAFPADYGNSVAGVFDLRMRNGNNQKHEFTGQFGFLGTELFAEGPINKVKGSSYLASYRYSSLQLFSSLGIDIGTNAVPHYQDGAFRLFFPGKKNSSFSLWGIGGKSAVDILISDQKTPDERNIYGENDRDQYFKTHMGILGAGWSKTLSEKTFLKTTLAIMTDQVDSYHELVYRHLDGNNTFKVDSLAPLLDYTFTQSRLSLSALVNHKLGRSLSLRIGANADRYTWAMQDSVRASLQNSDTSYSHWINRWDNISSGILLQPYIQTRWKPSDKLTFTIGVHAMYFSVSNSLSYFEPRLGAKWQLTPNQVLSAGAGRYSQLQPTYMYFYLTSSNGVSAPLNGKMDFTKSDHLVLSHQVILKSNIRILTEVYYQHLYNVPVENAESSFSLLNTGAGFNRFFPGELVNTGTGRNYGAELTIEKFFSKGWLFLFTASVFDSKYSGSDGILRNTDFNGKYAANALVSREWKTGAHSAFVSGIKTTTAGGRWYGPADISASNAARELVFDDSLRNTLQFNPYFRLDVKLNYKLNRKKATHEIGVDLVNVLNTKNVLKLTYAPDESNDPSTAIRKEYQLGFLPLFYYKIDF